MQTLLALLGSGMTFEEVLEDCPDLDNEDPLAVLEFAALAVGGQRVALGAA